MIYIASPYTHINTQIEEYRYLTVMEYCAYLMKNGKFPYSPIIYCHPMAIKHSLPTDAVYWQRFNEMMMYRANSLQVCHIPGWKESKGVGMEIAFAESIGIPIIHIDRWNSDS